MRVKERLIECLKIGLGSNKQEFQQNGRILWKNRFLKRTEFMKKRVKLIVLLIELLIRQAKEYEKKDEEK